MVLADSQDVVAPTEYRGAVPEAMSAPAIIALPREVDFAGTTSGPSRPQAMPDQQRVPVERASMVDGPRAASAPTQLSPVPSANPRGPGASDGASVVSWMQRLMRGFQSVLNREEQRPQAIPSVAPSADLHVATTAGTQSESATGFEASHSSSPGTEVTGAVQAGDGDKERQFNAPRQAAGASHAAASATSLQLRLGRLKGLAQGTVGADVDTQAQLIERLLEAKPAPSTTPSLPDGEVASSDGKSWLRDYLLDYGRLAALPDPSRLVKIDLDNHAHRQ
jgi:hypothetical protein